MSVMMMTVILAARRRPPPFRRQGNPLPNNLRGNAVPVAPAPNIADVPLNPPQRNERNDDPLEVKKSGPPAENELVKMSSLPKWYLCRVAMMVLYILGIWLTVVLLSFPHTTLVLQGNEHREVLDEYLRVAESYSPGSTRSLSAMIPPDWDPGKTQVSFYSSEICWRTEKQVCIKTDGNHITKGLITSFGSQIAATRNDTNFLKSWRTAFDEAHAHAKNASFEESAWPCSGNDYVKCSYNPSFFEPRVSFHKDIAIFVLLPVELLFGVLEYLTDFTRLLVLVRLLILYVMFLAGVLIIVQESSGPPEWLLHKFGHLVHSTIHLSVTLSFTIWLFVGTYLQMLLRDHSGMGQGKLKK